MDMKVVVGTTPPNHLPPSIDHMNQANSNCSTPYMSAASSPQRHHHCGHRPQLDFFYYSAPTSPRSSSSHFNNHHSLFDDDNVYDDYSADHVSLLKHGNSSVTVPFNWELEPGVAKNDHGEVKEDEEKEDFEFEFSGQLDMMVRPSLSSADELFDGGKIRPLKLPSPPNLRIIHDHNDNKISTTTSGCTFSPKSPKSAMSKFKDALSGSPKHRRNGSDIDPFEVAIRNTRETNDIIINNRSQERGRGRDRAKPITPANNTCSNNKRGSNNKGMSRSLSPLRVSEFALLDHHHQQLQDNQQQNSNETSNLARILGMGFPSSSKKWRLKDLFLFRSASEGHYKDSQSYSKRWTCRSSTMGSVSGSVSESGSVSKRRGQQASASAHEMHYTSNRAVSEEMKKKTNLPYKHGLLACLGFSPVLPQFSYTFPSSTSTPFS